MTTERPRPGVLESIAELSPEGWAEIESRLTPEQLQEVRQTAEAARTTNHFDPSNRRPPVVAWQGALAFNHLCEPGAVGRRTLMAYPQCLFRGEGLWLWGVDDSTLVHNIKVGNQTCYEVSGTPLPGRFFEANLTFEQFEKLLDPPEGGWQMQRLRELPPIPGRQRVRMRTAEIGNNIVLDVEGPITHAVMWGATVH